MVRTRIVRHSFFSFTSLLLIRIATAMPRK